MSQKGLQIGQGALQWTGRLGEPIAGNAPAGTKLQLARAFIQKIEGGGLRVDGLGAALQNGFESRGQMPFIDAQCYQRYAGRQFGFAPPKRVLRLQQFAQHLAQGRGQLSRRLAIDQRDPPVGGLGGHVENQLPGGNSSARLDRGRPTRVAR